jgi:capsular exopolysaccharide synthesis family protein
LEEELRKVVRYEDYLRIIQKRKWLVIAFLVLLTVTGTVRTINKESVYKAVAKILIQREKPKVIDIEEVFSAQTSWGDYHKTQYQMLKSRSLIRDVITRLKLWESPEFTSVATPSIIGRLRGRIYAGINNLKKIVVALLRKPMVTREKAEDREPPREMGFDEFRMALLIDVYLGRLSIEPVEETTLVNIGFQGSNPELAAQIANTHARAYIEHNLRLTFEVNEVAMEWLTKELEDLRKQAETSEADLQKFKEKEDIVALDSILFSKQAEYEDIVVQKISQLSNSLTTAKLNRIELGTVYEQLKKVLNKTGDIEAFPDIIKDAAIRTLQNDYTALLREYTELSEKYGEKHPKMASLKAKIDEQKARLQIEIEKLVKSIETQYETAREQEENLERELNDCRREAMSLNRKAAEYGVLKRDLESNRDLYNSLLKRLKETRVSSGIEASNISVVDSAEVPLLPVGPKRTREVLFSLFLGLTLGIGLAFLFEYFDNTIKSPYDVDIYLRRLPLLGPIGSFSTLESELITLIKPESNFSEAFRNIRTNLLLNFSSNGHNAFLITSPERGEGKTLVAANLSITMTQNRQKVLLIDANMRMPRLYSLFGVENSSGLSEVLKGEEDVDTIIKPTEIENISIITAGKIPLDPSELLGSEAMVKIVEEMKKKFDFVLIDAPGISAGPDSAVVSRLVDGVVILTQFGKTSRTVAQQAIDKISNIKTKISGVVINNVDYKRGRYHFPYYGSLLKEDSRIDVYSVEREIS